MHIHLDPIGGMAGDMFIAAVLDAFPELEPGVRASAQSVQLPVSPSGHVMSFTEGALRGRKFVMDEGEETGSRNAVLIPWLDVRNRLRAAPMDPKVRNHAIGIFRLLVGAEALVRGVDVDDVTFDETGTAQAVAVIVGAASVIAALEATGWSVGPLPLGSGRVPGPRGSVAVPTPVTLKLLEGFAVVDDGIPGERVTSTGVAILRYLRATSVPEPGQRKLLGSGLGFGKLSLEGRENCLRLLVLEDTPASESILTGTTQSQLAVVEFEVEDQPAADIAISLERLRASAGVVDALQMPAWGKKGRLMTHVQILADAASLDAVIGACFAETTTLALRHMKGATIILRPSREAEAADDVAGLTAREALRAAAEGLARVNAGDVDESAASEDDIAVSAPAPEGTV